MQTSSQGSAASVDSGGLLRDEEEEEGEGGGGIPNLLSDPQSVDSSGDFLTPESPRERLEDDDGEKMSRCVSCGGKDKLLANGYCLHPECGSAAAAEGGGGLGGMNDDELLPILDDAEYQKFWDIILHDSPPKIVSNSSIAKPSNACSEFSFSAALAAKRSSSVAKSSTADSAFLLSDAIVAARSSSVAKSSTTDSTIRSMSSYASIVGLKAAPIDKKKSESLGIKKPKRTDDFSSDEYYDSSSDSSSSHSMEFGRKTSTIQSPPDNKKKYKSRPLVVTTRGMLR